MISLTNPSISSPLKAWGKLDVAGEAGATAPGSSTGRVVSFLGASATYDLHRATRLLVQANRNPPGVAIPRKKLDLAAGITRDLGTGLEFQALLGRSGRGDRNTGLFLGASYRFGGGR